MSDPRTALARPDLAAIWLEGEVRAQRYAVPEVMTVVLPSAGLHTAPSLDAEQVDQVLFGETFMVLEVSNGFAWGQASRDGYVGFVQAAALGPPGPAPTHQVAALRTYAFAGPSIKTRALGPYSLNSLLAVEAAEGRFRKVAGTGWMVVEHLSPIGVHQWDVAGIAETFLGAPYLWGGRGSLGVDCSGLVQQAMLACGLACPRDSDQQAVLGREVAPQDLVRGDLVFWKGHVAIMLDATTVLHANGYHMATAREPLAQAVARIGATSTGMPNAYRRI